jgi:AraC-like DNA-binding protein
MFDPIVTPDGTYRVHFAVRAFNLERVNVAPGAISFCINENLLAFPLDERILTRSVNGCSVDFDEGPGDVIFAEAGINVSLVAPFYRKTMVIWSGGTHLELLLEEATRCGWRRPSIVSFRDLPSYHAACLVGSLSDTDAGEWFDVRRQLLLGIVQNAARHLGIDAYLRGAGDKDAPSRIRRSIDYINENFSRPIELQELAGVATLSLFHFVRLFKKATGMSPMRFLMQRRIEMAKALMLRHLDMPLVDVAASCGFASQSHMTTTFKRIIGVTPGALRPGASA